MSVSGAPVQKLKYPTDYKLDSVTLFAPGFTGPLDLKPQMIELNYFEDIYNNTISGSVVITDAVGLINFASLNGTEFINIRFLKSDDLKISIDRNFRVFAISDRRFDSANNNEIYKIEFCSEEYIVSEQYRVSKSYKNTSITKIVSDITLNYLGIGKDNNSKFISIDETLGTYDFVLPNKKPIETINWLANYAIPKNYPNGADILFFENRIGYFFTSLQNLFRTDAVLTFYYNPKNVEGDVYSKMTNVLTFELLSHVNTLDAVNSGTFANRTITIDLLRRKKHVYDFNYNEYFKNSISLNSSPVTNNYKNTMGKSLYDSPSKDMEAGALRYSVSNFNQQDGGDYTKNKPGTVQKDFNIEKTISNRVAQLSLSNYTKLKITVPGNSAIFAGMCINFFTYGMQQLNPNQKRPLDPYLSGKYLITAVRHIISPASYICVLEICKDSGMMNYSGVNDNDVTWKKLVSGVQNNKN